MTEYVCCCCEKQFIYLDPNMLVAPIIILGSIAATAAILATIWSIFESIFNLYRKKDDDEYKLKDITMD